MTLRVLLGFFSILGSLDPSQELVTPNPLAQHLTALLEHVNVHHSKTCAIPIVCQFHVDNLQQGAYELVLTWDPNNS